MRERLLPWPFYAVMSLVSLGCRLHLLTGPDEPNPLAQTEAAERRVMPLRAHGA